MRIEWATSARANFLELYDYIAHLQTEYVYIVNVLHGSRNLQRLRVKPWEVK